MKSQWQDIVPKIAKDLGVTEAYVKEEILKYKKELMRAIREHENVEYDLFFLGKMIINTPEAYRAKFLRRKDDERYPEEVRARYQVNSDKINLIFKEGRQPGKPKGSPQAKRKHLKKKK